MDSVIYAFSSFYCLCVEINKLFNIIHAFSICIHCVAKLIKYLKSKTLVFFFLFRRKKGIKNTKDVYRLIKILLYRLKTLEKTQFTRVLVAYSNHRACRLFLAQDLTF